MPDIFAVLAFVIISLVFFTPVFEGKVINQSDVTQYKGMSRELVLHKEQTGEDAMWTNSMFGGMPAYLIKGGKINDIFHSLQPALRLYLPYFTVGILFIYLLGFYFLLRVLRISPVLSFIGAIGFAFGSYNIIIIAVGHITKAYAIGYMAPVLAGILLLYQGRYIAGGLITLFAMGIQISTSHLQITYYTLLIIGLIILFELYSSIREKEWRHYLIATSLALGTLAFSVLPNITNLWITYEYGKYSTRGPSELTEGSGGKSKALPKDYILNDYSFGITEPLNLLIPNFKGGPTVSSLNTNSETYSLLLKNGYPAAEARKVIEQIPTYYGPQVSTSGPVYAGAIIVFLFILSMFLLRGKLKWWILTALAFSIALAWGKHFIAFSHFFIDYFPMYGKFRTVSMIMVIVSLLLPFAAMLGVNNLLSMESKKTHQIKALKYSTIITGGLLLLIGLFGPGLIDFSSANDASLPEVFVQAVRSDRGGLLRADAFKSLGFMAAAAVLIWLFIEQRMKKQNFLIILGILIIADLWTIDRRYLNKTDFIPARTQKNLFAPNEADQIILKDTSYYRVFNLSANPFNDAVTSYLHKSIGGYHGAKIRRYQELIERQISKNNMDVLNMLNTKYFIVPDQDNSRRVVQENPDALGNAWFVDTLIWVETPDNELSALNDFSSSREAIINKKFSDIQGIQSIKPGSEKDTIYLTSYSPDEMIYHSKTNGERFAVFSEIYYPSGWNAFIDGNPAVIAQVNYVLRGLVIPAGEHTIKFIFHPQSYYTGQKIAMASSLITILLLFGGLFLGYRYKRKPANEKSETPETRVK